MDIQHCIKLVINDSIDTASLTHLAKTHNINDLKTLVCTKYNNECGKLTDIYKLEIYESKSTIMFLRTLVGLERHFLNFFTDDGHLRAIYFNTSYHDKHVFKECMQKYWSTNSISWLVKDNIYNYMIGLLHKKNENQHISKVLTVCENIEFFFDYYFI